MSKNILGLSGRIIRAMKRELDPKAFTRNQAQRIIANTTDCALIEAFKAHQNKHIRRYCDHKLGLLHVAASEAQARALEVPVVTVEVELEPAPQPAVETEAERQIKMLAGFYDETQEFVTALAHEKGGDMAAVKRSLISRKSARTRAAKASATV